MGDIVERLRADAEAISVPIYGNDYSKLVDARCRALWTMKIAAKEIEQLRGKISAVQAFYEGILDDQDRPQGEGK